MSLDEQFLIDYLRNEKNLSDRKIHDFTVAYSDLSMREKSDFIYEFVGNKKLLDKINNAYKEQKTVDNTFIYTALSGKPMLSSDQIEFDESFIKVDFDVFKEFP